jgi:hypothetical protein
MEGSDLASLEIYWPAVIDVFIDRTPDYDIPMNF